MKKISIVLLLTAVMMMACKTGNSKSGSAAPVELTKAEFLTKVVNFERDSTSWNFLGKQPAIVDFYATWCGPCKIIAPILDTLANEYAGQVDFYKVDVDKEPELAQVFGINSIPTLLVIPTQGDPQLIQGLLSKEELTKLINDKLLK